MLIQGTLKPQKQDSNILVADPEHHRNMLITLTQNRENPKNYGPKSAQKPTNMTHRRAIDDPRDFPRVSSHHTLGTRLRPSNAQQRTSS